MSFSARYARTTASVSVLFSEPKIPQFGVEGVPVAELIWFQCSSASRKFLNFATPARVERVCYVSVLFSEPKIPQLCCASLQQCRVLSFSALQRAENSSMDCVDFSASRRRCCFSALQRAENSSIRTAPRAPLNARHVSVLFSEPKIPQFLEQDCFLVR